MVTRLQPKRPHSIKLEFADEPVSSFEGLALAERMAGRLGLWKSAEGLLPRRCGYSWLAILMSTIMGLLSGARGGHRVGRLKTWVPHQRDRALLPKLQGLLARRTLEKMARPDLILEDLFVPVFADGTLL